MATIGIDLGTTNSVVAFMEGGAPQVIPSPEGHKTTPSIVYYATADEIIVGEIAKRQLIVQGEKTVRSVKRLMGRRYSQTDEVRKSLVYKIIPTDEDNILLDVVSKKLMPEEVSAEILKRLRRTAEDFLGQDIEGAVITVPAYFNDNQRQATKRAATLAGLNVLRIINEPTAAALAFGLNANKSATIAVFDFGGGTFDISILTLDKDVFEVVATNGNTFLGGDNIDEILYGWIVEEIQKEHSVDIRGDLQACQRVREAAEKCKCELSTLRTTSINLPFIAADAVGPKHFQREVSRDLFEELTRTLLAQLLPPCRQALNDANLNPNQIDLVLLVGGSTRIPAVQRLVTEFFGKPPSKSINPDEAVALGAAIQAGIITGDIEEVLLLDITPLSLGVELEGGVFSTIISRNSSIPVTANKKYTTVVDNQTAVKIHVLQGERKMARENHSLAVFRLTDIESAPREVPEIEVKFHLDSNGILSVTATDLTSGQSKEVAVESYQHIMADDVEKAIRDASERAQEDKIFVSRAHQRVRSQRIFNAISSFLDEHADKVPDPDQRSVKEILIRFDIAIEKGDDQMALEQEANLMAFCDKFGIEHNMKIGRF